MNTVPNNSIESQLQALTEPVKSTGNLWKKALAIAMPATSRPAERRPWKRPEWMRSMNPAMAAMLVIVIGAALMGILLPSLGNRRPLDEVSLGGFASNSNQQYGVAAYSSEYAGMVVRGSMTADADSWDYAAGEDLEQSGFFEGAPANDAAMGKASRTPAKRAPASTTPGSQADDTALIERSVVRKATMELLTDDVRSVFLKVGMLVNEGSGEYVQDSSLTGEGDHAQANLTLRVAADRLSEVLNELRTLGKVDSEKVSGDDVTSQMVDLDARLRNEQRIEQELLELLDKRDDAPLKEILEVRTQIGQVRRIIEQLQAQQQQLSRLVSLATVLVIIRHDHEDEQPATTAIWSYFATVVHNAWNYGLEFLADSVAWLLTVIVGGLMWWVIAGIACLIAWRVYKKKQVQAEQA